ncbi:Uncharacterised protein [Mycobacterium tuberculosis]|nr:Uncharacterised protein [Mycobacterium tuberculosis]
MSRRSVPVTVPAASHSSITCSMPEVRTGCPDASTKTPCPAFTRRATAGAKATGSRRLRYQYSASASSPRSHCPVTVDCQPTPFVGAGASPASSRCSTFRTRSTIGECEA